ncbi:envelope biogenesis factor ElyC [Proteus faecis]|uniref:Envelope biogenesis factor ElyC n=1 Tax=Proteus faecis TaxID=2050967 RepID=A0AAW7CPJ7_9GAMM|nr:envelope biogenesis factor ElyC [Proteus faecis]MDL5165724.1 envelope biogenesis factor ElyC [Proteus faecis]MDL5274012.1 envelope biogenesis factor ElyC [Proteus faecis]MDL5277582.1 envelope biogenesis factor ElyC [Proteus faecis]MDL5306571.1 envelope biogenesis factor ElyC [Proteus faecis]MDL5310140.1 envelope biogenesis factor ElyC [Proteus faecis]
MLFLLKKYVAGFLMPLPLLLLIAFFALALLWFTRWQKTGKSLLTVVLILLTILGIQPVADTLLMPSEKEYQARYELRENSQQDVNYIVVLGGGFTYNPEWAPSANLLNNSLFRVTEGVRLYYRNPNATLIFTGGAGVNQISNAEVAAQVAQSLGVPANKTIALSTPKDTEEEAYEVDKLIGKQPFLLVTSANHLARAERFFLARNMNPIVAPANQLAITSPLHPWEKYFPSATYFQHSERAWYEFLGSIWQSVKPAGRPTEIPENAHYPSNKINSDK